MLYDNADGFFNLVARQQRDQQEKEIQKKIAKIQKRITKLDQIFKGIYENDITGAISHKRFLKWSAEYDVEQKDLQKGGRNSERDSAA